MTAAALFDAPLLSLVFICWTAMAVTGMLRTGKGSAWRVIAGLLAVVAAVMVLAPTEDGGFSWTALEAIGETINDGLSQ